MQAFPLSPHLLLSLNAKLDNYNMTQKKGGSGDFAIVNNRSWSGAAAGI